MRSYKHISYGPPFSFSEEKISFCSNFEFIPSYYDERHLPHGRWQRLEQTDDIFYCEHSFVNYSCDLVGGRRDSIFYGFYLFYEGLREEFIIFRKGSCKVYVSVRVGFLRGGCPSCVMWYGDVYDKAVICSDNNWIWKIPCWCLSMSFFFILLSTRQESADMPLVWARTSHIKIEHFLKKKKYWK